MTRWDWKKSHLWVMMKRFSLCMWSIFRYDCRVFLPRLSSASVTGFQCCFFNLLWCYWYNSLHISIQTDACVWWYLNILQWISGRIYFPLKTPMTLDHCLLQKSDLLRAYFLPNNIKTFQWGLIYSETENWIVLLSLHKCSLLLLLLIASNTDRWRCISQDSLL